MGDERPEDLERGHRVDADPREIDRIEVHPDVRPVDVARESRGRRPGWSDAPSWFSKMNVMSGCAVGQARRGCGTPCRARRANSPRTSSRPKNRRSCAAPSWSRDVDLPRHRRDRSSRCRGAPWKKSHHPPDTTQMRSPCAASALGDRVDRHAVLENVMQVQIEVAQAEPREHLERRQQRLALVRGRRRENARTQRCLGRSGRSGQRGIRPPGIPAPSGRRN